jgi:hypothetical protein
LMDTSERVDSYAATSEETVFSSTVDDMAREECGRWSRDKQVRQRGLSKEGDYQ